MRLPLLACLICVAVAGCAQRDESTLSAAPVTERANGQYLAYEHSVDLDVDEKRVAAAHEAAVKACSAAAAEQCVLLESHLSAGSTASARLKFRAKAAGIKKIVGQLTTHGEVIRQSVTAEDLAAPIADSAKKLALLSDYRSKLEGLRANASQNIDALIKVNQELAQVQSEIESLSGERAHLVQRVETEILNVAIFPTYRHSFWRPIGEALGQFGDDLSRGIASAIGGLAYLIPWSIALALLWWSVRKTRAWRKRRYSAGT